MQLLEKEVEDFIYNDLAFNDGDELDGRGLQLQSYRNYSAPKWFRQLSIEPYGITDIVGFYRRDGYLHADLLELKAVPIALEHFEQISRYKRGLEIYLKNTFKNFGTIQCYLIGNGYDGLYIQNGINIHVASYEYNLHGIMFDHHAPYSGWQITNAKDRSFRKRKINAKEIY